MIFVKVFTSELVATVIKVTKDDNECIFQQINHWLDDILDNTILYYFTEFV